MWREFEVILGGLIPLRWTTCGCCGHGVDLMALMLEHADDDLLHGSLAVAESRGSGWRNAVELLIGQLGEQAQGASCSAELVE